MSSRQRSKPIEISVHELHEVRSGARSSKTVIGDGAEDTIPDDVGDGKFGNDVV